MEGRKKKKKKRRETELTELLRFREKLWQKLSGARSLPVAAFRGLTSTAAPIALRSPDVRRTVVTAP